MSKIVFRDEYGVRPWLMLTIAAIVLACVVAGIVVALEAGGGSPGERPVIVPVIQLAD